MLGLFLWAVLFASTVALVVFSWRGAMRRRGFRLVDLLEQEGVLHSAIDVPVRSGKRRRRGTLVLTRKRLAGFSHRMRFTLVRGKLPSGVLSAEDGWVVVRPVGRDGKPIPPDRALRFRVGDAAGEWVEEGRRALRLR